MKIVLIFIFLVLKYDLFSQSEYHYFYPFRLESRIFIAEVKILRKNNDSLNCIKNIPIFYKNDVIFIRIKENDTLITLPSLTDIAIQPPLGPGMAYANVLADSCNKTYIFSMDSLDMCITGYNFEKYNYPFYFLLKIDNLLGYSAIKFNVTWE